MTLVLPRLVAGRDFADEMVARWGPRLNGVPVVVDSRGLRSGTAAFADQLVRRILVEHPTAKLTLVGGPADFTGYFVDSAKESGVDGRLEVTPNLAPTG